MPTLYIETWGCQMNEYDSKRIAELLEATHGLQLVSAPEDADVLIMNTCSIREKAQEKVFSRLGQWRLLKTAAPRRIIGVGGCVASQEGNAIRKRAPYVDVVFGPQTLHRLPALLQQVQHNGKPAIDITFPAIEKFDNLPPPRADGPSAFVSIQEGCNKFCTYCIVPYTRGEEINRPVEDVLREIVALAKQGVKEITLLGQNVNAYQGRLENQKADLALLIRLIAEIKEIVRIRFTTSHPNAFSDRLIRAFQEIPKLANHLHLPVQSGSDIILARMGRAHTALEYRSKIQKLRKIRPDIAISSDFIVGFPGETEEDFQKTLDLVHDVRPDQSFSFAFSPRPGTPAASLPHPVPLEVQKQRLHQLQAILKDYTQAYNEGMKGQQISLLVSGPSKKNPEVLIGRSDNNRIVYFEGPAALIGHIVPVVITDALPHCLTGQWVTA